MADARYNIVLIDPPGYGHAMAFWEVAMLLEASLTSLGIPVTLQNNRFEADATNIVLGYHLFPDAAALRGLRYIPYQLEQFSPESVWITPAQVEVLRGAAEVWEYSARNLSILEAQGIGNVKLLPLGYHPKLEMIPPAGEEEKVVDVLHYGSLNPRRQKVLSELQQAGLRVESLMGVYGRERDEAIARAKLVISIHFYQAKILPQVRIAYLLNNAVPVVCEASEEETFAEMIATVPYVSLTETCVALVKDRESRQALGRRGYELFRQRPMTEYLRRLL